ncbi:MAG: bifunctional folylpolyglutamate synthase/dihydrofolate synthase [Candidatus Diapherotrites archaeon]|nr:bifunctional folylpolyglutamate synthase/dihydrofolate synthase [Candidatus Diapherotrites archaeon]
MDYREIEDYLYSLPRLGLRNGYARVRELLDKWGNPDRHIKFVQVAGTNGKGSVTTMVSTILQANGFKTGKFVSPHLDALTERIQVNGRNIPETELVRLVESAISLNHNCTFFELMTAVAIKYFYDQGVDYGVLEVGLGGRLDATTVVKPEVCVITNVDYDHMHILGKTIGEIAREKSGVIKPGCTVVTAERKPEALKVIKEACMDKGVRLVQVDRNNYKLAMLGEFQQWNAACAVEAVKALHIPGIDPTKGLSSAIIPGRAEKHGNILMDVGHNPGCMHALSGVLNELNYEKLFIVFGAKRGKDVKEMLKVLPKPDKLIITKYKIAPNGMETKELVEKAKAAGLSSRIIVIQNVREALELAKSLATEKDLVVVTGSTFTVSEARGVERQLTV